MNFDSILKEARGHKSVYRRLNARPATWQGLFNVANLKHNLKVEGQTEIGGCTVRAEGSRLVCFPISFTMPGAAALEAIPDIDLDILIDLSSYSPVTFDNPHALILYTHLDLIAAYLKLGEEEFVASIGSDPRFIAARRIYRPSLLEVNGNSIFLTVDGEAVQCTKAVSENVKLAMLALGIATLELPEDYDPDRTARTLEDYDRVLRRIRFPAEERSFNLKFKKLGAYKANGFYSAEMNTVIVDPREVDVFYHELGHLVFDRGVSTKIRIEAPDSEAFAQAFYQLVMGVDWNGETHTLLTSARELRT